MTVLGLSGLALVCLAFLMLGSRIALRMRTARTTYERLALPGTDIDRLGLRGAVEFVKGGGATCASLAQRLELDRRLAEAGRPLGGITGEDFVAFGVLWTVGGALCGVLLARVSGLTAPVILASSLVLALVGLWIWWLHIGDPITDRREQIRREFPFLLDTIVMIQTVGATLFQALEIYVRASPTTTLAREVRFVLNAQNLANRPAHALRAALDRITAEEVRSALDAIAKAEELGTPMNAQLRENADVARARRVEQIEKSTESLKARIAVPTGLILVAVLLIVIGPAFVELAASGLFSR